MNTVPNRAAPDRSRAAHWRDGVLLPPLRRFATLMASLMLVVLGAGVLPAATSSASAATASVLFDQCANGSGAGPTCNWINGDLNHHNSTYVEGNTVPQRVGLSGLVPGSTHTLTLQYNTTKNGLHAYDFLTTWNASEPWITEADRCSTIAGCVGAPESTLPVPADPNVPAGYYLPGGVFTMRGGTLTSATVPTLASGTYAGDSYTQQSVTFTVASSGQMCSSATSCGVVLWFGAHVASAADWGVGQGAASIHGSPYHVALASLDGAAIGLRDNQMMASVAAPALTLQKTATTSSFSSAGTVVHYNYLVSNNGDVTLNPVVVTDPMVGLSPVSCPATSLAANFSETCTATYTTTAADVTKGSITNVATATGTPPSGPVVTATDTITIPVLASGAGITIVKTADVSGYSAAGTKVTYNYLVTDSGATTLTGVAVTDDMNGLSPVTCASTTLNAGASENCSATYTTNGDDVTDGSITNTGVAVGTPPTGPAITASDTLSIPATTGAAISVTKTASVSGFSAAGTKVTYDYVVTNTGSTLLNQVGVTDAMTGLSAVACPSPTLAVGASETCVATYVTTAADVTAGDLVNTAIASGTPPSGAAVTATATLIVPATTGAAIAVKKTASVSGFSSAGTTITYNYTVTNTGSASLSQVGVSDAMTGLSAVTCPSTTLASGASEICSATYVTTAADVTNGQLVNTAIATGTPASGAAVSATTTLTLEATTSGDVSVVETSDHNTVSGPGAVVTFTYDVTNTGTIPLSGIVVTESNAGITVTCPDATLAVGASETCTATYTATAADVTAGTIVSSATVSAATPSNSIITASSTRSVTVHPKAITGKKKPAPHHAKPKAKPGKGSASGSSGYKIPSAAPSTGAGGSATASDSAALLTLGGLILLAGLGMVGVTARRRRRA